MNYIILILILIIAGMILDENRSIVEDCVMYILFFILTILIF